MPWAPQWGTIMVGQATRGTATRGLPANHTTTPHHQRQAAMAIRVQVQRPTTPKKPHPTPTGCACHPWHNACPTPKEN